MRNLLFPLLLLTSSILCAQDPIINVEQYELPNGLKVYLNEDKNASNVYGAVWVNAGGKDDPAEATGIAHYLEHMLFKGTDELGTQNYETEKTHLDSIKILYDELAITKSPETKLQIQKMINAQELKASQFAIPNEFDRLVKSIGGSGVNAGTNYDYTYYYNFFPANQMTKWLDIYSHRFQNPVFRLFQSELEAVYEEKNRAGDDLQRRVFTKFNEYIYGDHPYSTQTVLGSVEHLKNPSLTKMYEYFQKYYVANNMALVLSGNFDATEVKPLITESFGKLKRGKEPEFPQYTRNSFDGREVEKVRITPIKVGFMGYKLVPAGHPDRPALEIVGGMMSNSNQTGFIDKMNLNNELLYAGGEQDFLEEDGSAFIFFVPKVFGGSLKKFEGKIRDGFQEIAKGNFTDEYFESVKFGIYRNYELSMENLSTRGRTLGLSFIYDIDYKDYLSFPEKIRNISKEEVQKAAEKYYGDDYFTLQSRTGFPKKTKLEKPSYKPISERTEESSAYAKRFQALPENQAEPNFIDLKNDFGITDDYIFYTKNMLNDIFTLRFSIAGGITKDPDYALLAEALNSTGTSDFSAADLKRKFADVGATYFFNADYNSFDISITGLDNKFDETVDLIETLIADFNPTNKTIKLLYNQRKTENKLNNNNPATGGSILYSYGLFGEQSSYKSRMPAGKLKKLEPAVLKNKMQALLSNGMSSIHYVGQKEETELIEKISASTLFRKNAIDQYTFLEAEDVAETTFYVVNDKKSIQSYVYYIVNGEPLNYEEDYKKEAFNSYYTNSLSGLLFQEVREFRSLAYSTGGNYIDPIYEPEKRGRLVLFTGSQSDKTTDAVSVVLGLINDMPTYESRLSSIKDGLILTSSSSRPDFRLLSRTAESFIKTGYLQDPNEINFEQYSKLEFDDIVSFYEKNIKNKPVTVTIYGDASKFDLDRLRTLGPVKELELDDIIVE
ncbi:insulinase family protein [uncultured Marivirga sp.]|uniref:M16 family metallopeptidase n=1 Tax=uncultured Marivirga sp. TaxID=1123707 RepID=UPI0030EB776A|tara:strand:- start:29252 stop:32110 length:2859 start_codon:yes stop_codon:yes gene_type:complete